MAVVIEDKTVNEQITNNKPVERAYKALRYRLQNSSDKLGEPTGEGLPIVFRVYRQGPDSVAKTPGIEIIISYRDNAVLVYNLRETS